MYHYLTKYFGQIGMVKLPISRAQAIPKPISKDLSKVPLKTCVCLLQARIRSIKIYPQGWGGGWTPQNCNAFSSCCEPTQRWLRERRS